MDFYAMLDQVVALLHKNGRTTYRALQRQFALDDAARDDLKAELFYTYPQVVDDAGRGLKWTGDEYIPAAILNQTTKDSYTT
jgi:hypothetical protein